MQSLHVPKSARPDTVVSEYRCLKKNRHLYHQGDPATDVHFLLDGALKAYRVTPAGEEGIIRFYFPGELLWTDGSGGGFRTMSVMSIDASRICSMSLGVLQRLMSEHPDVQIRCYELLSKMISDEQAFISMLSRGDAERRLAFILLRICRNRCSMESDRPQFTVPMTRGDIGNYLGLRVETVSRAFSRLEERGVVEVNGRKVRIIDLAALERIAMGQEIYAGDSQ
jgi:CRP/FNR family transcriptional regulator